jgi:P4 family phage/plasmid primase-like protien
VQRPAASASTREVVPDILGYYGGGGVAVPIAGGLQAALAAFGGDDFGMGAFMGTTPPTNADEVARAVSALQYLSPDAGRADWLRWLWAARAAGVPEDAAREWSRGSQKFDEEGFIRAWESFDPKRSSSIGAGTLYREASTRGWVWRAPEVAQVAQVAQALPGVSGQQAPTDQRFADLGSEAPKPRSPEARSAAGDAGKDLIGAVDTGTGRYLKFSTCAITDVQDGRGAEGCEIAETGRSSDAGSAADFGASAGAIGAGWAEWGLTDVGNAVEVLRLLGGRERVMWLAEVEQWAVWSDGRWDIGKDVAQTVRWAFTGLRKLARQCEQTAVAEAAGEPAKRDARRAFGKWADHCASTQGANDGLQALKSVPGVLRTMEEAGWDADPLLLGLDGGRKVVCLKSGGVRASRPEDRVSRWVAVRQVGDAARAVRWKKFIGEVLGEQAGLADWVSRWAGYAVTGCMSEHLIVFHHGAGRNGKSLFMKTLLRLLRHATGNGYADTIRASGLTLVGSGAGGGATPSLTRIDGRRLGVANELTEGMRWDEGLLKELSGGDGLQVRGLYEAERFIQPVMKLCVVGNQKPVITGTDIGIWSRMRLVPWEVSYEGREDRGLEAELWRERAHILAWLIEQAQEWQRRGLDKDVPGCVLAATAEYKESSDILGRWLAERCIQTPADDEHTVTGVELYADWAQWAKTMNEPCWSQGRWSRRLSDYAAGGWRLAKCSRSGGARHWRGVKLRGFVDSTGQWVETVKHPG